MVELCHKKIFIKLLSWAKDGRTRPQLRLEDISYKFVTHRYRKISHYIMCYGIVVASDTLRRQ